MITTEANKVWRNYVANDSNFLNGSKREMVKAESQPFAVAER